MMLSRLKYDLTMAEAARGPGGSRVDLLVVANMVERGARVLEIAPENFSHGGTRNLLMGEARHTREQPLTGIIAGLTQAARERVGAPVHLPAAGPGDDDGPGRAGAAAAPPPARPG